MYTNPYAEEINAHSNYTRETVTEALGQANEAYKNKDIEALYRIENEVNEFLDGESAPELMMTLRVMVDALDRIEELELKLKAS